MKSKIRIMLRNPNSEIQKYYLKLKRQIKISQTRHFVPDSRHGIVIVIRMGILHFFSAKKGLYFCRDATNRGQISYNYLLAARLMSWEISESFLVSPRNKTKANSILCIHENSRSLNQLVTIL